MQDINISGRDMDIECIHNLYKSAYGIRPHHYDFDMMSDSDVSQALVELAEEINPPVVTVAEVNAQSIGSSMACVWPV